MHNQLENDTRFGIRPTYLMDRLKDSTWVVLLLLLQNSNWTGQFEIRQEIQDKYNSRIGTKHWCWVHSCWSYLWIFWKIWKIHVRQHRNFWVQPIFPSLHWLNPLKNAYKLLFRWLFEPTVNHGTIYSGLDDDFASTSHFSLSK